MRVLSGVSSTTGMRVPAAISTVAGTGGKGAGAGAAASGRVGAGAVSSGGGGGGGMRGLIGACCANAEEAKARKNRPEVARNPDRRMEDTSR